MGKLNDVKDETRVTVGALVAAATPGLVARNGATYTAVTLTDGESTLTVNFFDQGGPFAVQAPEKGALIDVTLSRNAKGNVNQHGWRHDPDLKFEDLVRVAPVDQREACDELTKAMAEMGDRPLVKAVVERTFAKACPAFLYWSAAKAYHHDELRGLLWHTLRMTRTARAVADIYGLDRSLLVAGAIMHDVGKVVELSTDEFGAAEYTKPGSLFGHLFIGAEMVDDACAELGIDRNAEEIALLKHEILSHHGKQEMGAVRPPQTAEAFALSAIDDLDAKMWMYEETLKKTEPGKFAERATLGLGIRPYAPEMGGNS